MLFGILQGTQNVLYILHCFTQQSKGGQDFLIKNSCNIITHHLPGQFELKMCKKIYQDLVSGSLIATVLRLLQTNFDDFCNFGQKAENCRTNFLSGYGHWTHHYYREEKVQFSNMKINEQPQKSKKKKKKESRGVILRIF